MKKFSCIFIVLSVLLLLCSCQKSLQSHLNEDLLQIGLKAIDKADAYLEYDLTAAEARTALNLLIDETYKFDERDALYLRGEITAVYTTIGIYDRGSGIGSLDDVKESRDHLYHFLYSN